jgi:hypothetical protein
MKNEIMKTINQLQESSNVPQKPKGAELADYFRTHSMSAEAGKIMNEARKEFRQGFAFKHDLDDNG